MSITTGTAKAEHARKHERKGEAYKTGDGTPERPFCYVIRNKAVRSEIQWRSKSQWSSLPEKDLKWTRFAIVEEEISLKQGEVAPAASMIVDALEHSATYAVPKFEFRIKP